VDKTINNNIRKIRQLKGYSQEYVADKLNLTQGGYGRIERGEVKVKIETLEKLSKIFDMPASVIQYFHKKDLYRPESEHKIIKEAESTYFKQAVALEKCKEEVIYLRKIIASLELRLRDKEEIINLLKKHASLTDS
jgi:XRE family transcriptional regulator, regulator of sulfur utilization